jgi:hypothetical protein
VPTCHQTQRREEQAIQKKRAYLRVERNRFSRGWAHRTEGLAASLALRFIFHGDLRFRRGGRRRAVGGMWGMSFFFLRGSGEWVRAWKGANGLISGP